MKWRLHRVISTLLIVSVLIGSFAFASLSMESHTRFQFAPTKAYAVTYVWRTRTGARYHRHYCVDDHYCWKISLSKANSQRLTPCRVCKPPR